MSDEPTTNPKRRSRRSVWVIILAVVALALLVIRLSCGFSTSQAPKQPDTKAFNEKTGNWQTRRLGKSVDALAAMRRSLEQESAAAIALFVFDDVDPLGKLRLEGRVIGSNGDAVAGIEVVISGVPRRTTQTEADGSFYFDELIPQLYRVYARGEAGSAGPISLQLTERSEPITLVLSAGGELVFVVHTKQGDPVVDATVAMSAYEATLGADAPAFEVVAQTDATGRATIGNVPQVMMRYLVTADGHASSEFGFTRVPALRHEIDVVIERAAPMHGLVVQADGTPVPGACIMRFSDVPCQATTDAAGKFQIAPVMSDVLPTLFIASHPQQGWMYTMEPKGQGTAANPYVLTLAPYRRVKGVVLRGDDTPVVGALLRVGATMSEFPGSSTPLGGLIASDAQGQFTLLMPSNVLCRVVAYNGEYTSNAATIEANDAAPEPIVLRMADGATSDIRGRVFLPNGDPAEGAQIGARLADGEQRSTDSVANLRGPSTTLTNAEGAFHLTGLEDEAYEVLAWDASSAGRRYPAGKAIAVAGATDVTIRLPAWGSITAIAKQANGTRLPAQVCLKATSASNAVRTGCAKNSEGQVRVDGMFLGSYSVQLESDGFKPVTFSVVIGQAGELVDAGVHILEAK